MELEGKNVIYVGGFGGIGEKCVESFLKKCVKSVLIFDLNSNEEYLKYLQNTYKNSYVDYVPLDLTKRESIERAYKVAKDKIGSFDVVVNGSGIINEHKVNLLVEINLTGLIQSSLIAMEYMNKGKGGQGGCIVNISSTAGLSPTAIFCIYAATKCAVSSFTRALANPIYFDVTGVSFITICPGATATPILNDVASNCISAKYFAALPQVMGSMKSQSAEVCANNMIQVLETAPNGSTWVLDEAAILEVHFPEVWAPVLNY